MSQFCRLALCLLGGELCGVGTWVLLFEGLNVERLKVFKILNSEFVIYNSYYTTLKEKTSEVLETSEVFILIIFPLGNKIWVFFFQKSIHPNFMLFVFPCYFL